MKHRYPDQFRLCFHLVALTMACCLPAAAATLTVDATAPADFSAIGPALAAAAPGDTILVAPGLYTGPDNRDLDFAGRDLVLLAWDGPETTTIDGGGGGRAFRFHGAESPAAVVDGFTIRDAPVGSPIRVENGSAPTIRNCRIVGNAVSGFPGGAARISGSSPRFEQCVFAENGTDQHGGAVAVSGGAPQFVGCTVVGNVAGGRGGGFWLDAGALVGLESCTVTGNGADTTLAGFDGGGLALTSGASATITRTILWGNRGTLGDELLAEVGTVADFGCSLVDFGGLAGAGAVILGPGCLDADPHFCLPAYCRDLAWTNGIYTLAANSPGLPANSPCGQLIGAAAAGCDTMVVWIGAGGTGDWHDATNWSTGAVPGAGDNAQINRGEVNVFGLAEIASLVQCPESVPSDTLWIRSGGCLTYGVVDPLAGKAEPAKSTQSGTEQFEYESCGVARDYSLVIITESGEMVLDPGAHLLGPGGFVNRGTVSIGGGQGTTVAATIDNEGAGGDGAQDKDATAGFGRGVLIDGGLVSFTRPLTNSGHWVVAAGATMALDSTFTNTASGLLAVGGTLAGGGRLDNLGTVELAGGPAESLDLELVNLREPGSGAVGQVAFTVGPRQVAAPLTNRGDVIVTAGAQLDLQAELRNRTTGTISLEGALAGPGLLHNLGWITKAGPDTARVGSPFANAFDHATGRSGLVRALGGVLAVDDLASGGTVTIGPAGTVAVGGEFDNGFQGSLEGSGVLDVAAGIFAANAGSVSPGSPYAALTLRGAVPLADAAGKLRCGIGGPVPGTGYDRVVIDGTANLGGTLHVSVDGGYAPAAGDTFRIVSTTGGVSGSFDRLAGSQLTPFFALQPLITTHEVLLVATAGPVGNAFPVARRDTFAVDISGIPVLAPLANDTDPDADGLTIVSLVGQPALGTAFINAGSLTISYIPPSAYAAADSLAYVVTDGAGAVDTTMITIALTDLADAGLPAAPRSSASLQGNAPNPFNPVTRIAYELPVAGPVRLEIFDVRGRLVAVLVDGPRPAGRQYVDWWGLDRRGARLAAGTYIARLSAGGTRDTHKMLLLK